MCHSNSLGIIVPALTLSIVGALTLDAILSLKHTFSGLVTTSAVVLGLATNCPIRILRCKIFAV